MLSPPIMEKIMMPLLDILVIEYCTSNLIDLELALVLVLLHLPGKLHDLSPQELHHYLN